MGSHMAPFICCEASLSAEEQLTCEFEPTGASVPATRDAEGGSVTCFPPEGVPGQLLRYRVLDSGGCDIFPGGRTFQRRVSSSIPVDHADKTDSRAAEIDGVSSPEPKAASSSRMGGLGPFAVMTLAYVLFTTTDGGVRVIVLLHAYQQGITALALAAIFSGYELAGVIVNLLAGVAGARWGFKATLVAGLSFQLCSLAMLMGWQDNWNNLQAIVFITIAQILNGIAKDLVKLGGKSVSKLVTPEEKQLKLFKLVALVTGFKNSFKGVGYLIGAALLTANYYSAIAVMMGLICIALPCGIFGLDWQLGRAGKKNAKLSEVFSVNYNIGVLSIARFFLFASRDLWFEVTLPYFLRNPASGIGWSRLLVGVFLAVWIIVYVHSYLIVRYAEGNKIAMSVGFYYMANAGGRLIGTLLSGFLYTYVV
ncbi:hypothetical protein WJX73_008033 [Symbiochloris irregularis]|uniref:Uncharacterized protein n=1 Tax=Symbiochloris irregularis TaxID=706552 RepID=A0AAW1NWE1_9CHLO